MEVLVNNINLYYNVYGTGSPIILLHGNRETNTIFDKLIEELQKNYTVYAIDSRCHGNSSKTKEISYDLMSNDIICFIEKLKINKPILYGFSDGGIIGLLIAIKKPDLLKQLIVSGPNLNPRGLKLHFRLYSILGYLKSKNKLFKLMFTEPNIKLEDLHKIRIPTVLIAGEKDIVKEKHTRLIAKNIKDCKLEILKNEYHSTYVVHSNKLYEIIKKYL